MPHYFPPPPLPPLLEFRITRKGNVQTRNNGVTAARYKVEGGLVVFFDQKGNRVYSIAADLVETIEQV